jgi:exonuclease SbcD
VKLLHTADWHLNDRLGRLDRTDHLRQRVEKIAHICEEQSVDVLVVAGDLFSEQAEVSSRRNDIAKSFRHLRETFAEFFRRGGIILGVTGNHDQDGRVLPYLELARAGMDLAEPPRQPGDLFDPGKMYLLDRAFVGRVRDQREGFDVQFALLPFPSLGRILTGTETATTPAEFNRPVSEAVANWIRSLPNLDGYDVNLRTVLVAHLNVTGADIGRGMFRISEGADVVLDAAALPTGFDYVALGHVHLPQCLRGLSHVRYSGSLDRLDFGECGQDKGVVLVDLGLDGRRGEPRFVVIEPTPLLVATVMNSADVAEQLAAQVPDKAASVVRIVVEPSAADAETTVDLAIRDLPNVAAVEWRAPEVADAASVPDLSQGGGVRAPVLEYLNACLDPNDPQRDGLLALAARFLDHEGFQ